MNLGNYDLFGAAFPNDLLPYVFRMILEEWPKFERPERPLENRITNRFVGHLNSVCRRPELFSQALPFSFDYRKKLSDADADSESGEIDIVVDSYSPHPDAYFSFECKRLNVTFDSGFRSLAAEYVGEEGMCCFVSIQYPCTCGAGGMIGYVMDGNISAAKSSINHSLSRRQIELRLQEPTQLHPATILANDPSICQTLHSVDGVPLLIYHLLVAY